MPYSGPGDPKLPSNVKKLPEKKRRQWVTVWNSTFERCSDSKDECEAKAFKAANAAVSNESIQTCVLAYKGRYPNATEGDAVLWCMDEYERQVARSRDEANEESVAVMLEHEAIDYMVEEATPEEKERFDLVFSAAVIPAPRSKKGVWSKNNRLYPPKAVDETFSRSKRFLAGGGVVSVFANHASSWSTKLPVGAVTEFYRDGKAIRFRAGIVGTTEGQDVIRLLNAGVLKTVSLRSHDWDSEWDDVDGREGKVEVIKHATIHGIDFAIYPGLSGTTVKKEDQEMDLKELTLAELQEARPDLITEILEAQAPEPEVVEVTPAEVTLQLAIAEASNTGMGSLVAKYLEEHCKAPEDIPEHIEAARTHALSELYAGRRPAASNNKGQSGEPPEPEGEDEDTDDELSEEQQEMVGLVRAGKRS